MRDYTCLDGMIGNAESMLKMAYEKGYQQGVSDNSNSQRGVNEELRDAAYNRGINDMFDAIYKIVALKLDGGMSLDDIEEIFGTQSSEDIVRSFRDNPKGIIENIKAYEDGTKKKGKPSIQCVCLTYRYCLHNMNCESCDIGKAIKDAADKAKENEND